MKKVRGKTAFKLVIYVLAGTTPAQAADLLRPQTPDLTTQAAPRQKPRTEAPEIAPPPDPAAPAPDLSPPPPNPQESVQVITGEVAPFEKDLPPARVPDDAKETMDEAFSKGSEVTRPNPWLSGDGKAAAPPKAKAPAKAVKTEKAKDVAVTSILDLQEKTEETTLFLVDKEVTLFNLNPAANNWFVLQIKWSTGGVEQYHLETLEPQKQKLALSHSFPHGILIHRGNEVKTCELWDPGNAKSTISETSRDKPYAPLCDGLLYMRNKIDGYRTMKEWVVEFLRDNMWGGEAITSFVKQTVFKDFFLIKNETSEAVALKAQLRNADLPPAGRIEKQYENQALEPRYLGLEIKAPEEGGKMIVGKWYEAKGAPHVYISAIQAQMIAKDIFDKHKDRLKKLDPTELGALSYMVAFDLTSYEMHYALGTEHPRIDWSERVREKDRDPRTGGPDGIGESTPLVGTGLISPFNAKRVVSTFTAGFKRSHGAFKWGQLATVNKGSHYGFAEQGVIFSRLQPGLATVYVTAQGDVDMRTWGEEDNFFDMRIRHARQNGVAIIEKEPGKDEPTPGPLVANWMQGNWSGSEDMKFRTLRAGICMVKGENNKKFLVYGYFSSATPVAMAAIFKAYNCYYAQHLDMNALEHTYLALYVQRDDKNYYPQHLITGMKVLDERFEGNVPRFIGYPDNRDFFYLLRRLDKDAEK